MGIASVAVYTDDDQRSSHVSMANEARSLGHGTLADTYLAIDKVLAAVERSGADAVHPGYGFLSENANFATALEARGVTFIGPRPEHLANFGLKHEARRLASAAGVLQLPGSGVIANVKEALQEADAIGYPIMLKSSAGGGGIGMQRCDDAAELKARFKMVERLASNAFGDSRLFVERCVTTPRHVEVQAFGDGMGGIAIFGDRDCSLQRRHQKVVEECPAYGLPDSVRERMHADASSLLASVEYRSAGTVEFLYDAAREEATFLEVNTRLQVEHGVTELVYDLDLVQLMIELAAGELAPLAEITAKLNPTGHAMQARVCTEDPNHQFRPTPGTLASVEFPSEPNVRIDTWLRPGAEISPKYDSLVAKVMSYSSCREEARQILIDALEATVLHGTETNREYLVQALETNAFAQNHHDTTTLSTFDYQPTTVEVIAAGAQTSVQQWPGRMGYWHVGVPPSGPMDDLSFRIGNRVLGNDEGATGLELALNGPTLEFHCATTVLIAGGVEDIKLTRAEAAKTMKAWQCIQIARGDRLEVGAVVEGMRAYVLFEGGLAVPNVMGSAATFDLGCMGGLNGRTLEIGDLLRVHRQQDSSMCRSFREISRPALSARHKLRVTLGPHSTSDFLTSDDLDAFLNAKWVVHYHSSRTGIRLIGPRPVWARPDGGEAGLHPSNVHDNAYAIGAIDFTGDMPVILGPDGPSLGGFVCPAAVIEADRWKLGQLGAGDEIRLAPVSEDAANSILREQNQQIAVANAVAYTAPAIVHQIREDPILSAVEDIVVRRASQDSLLVEFGPAALDIEVRLRVDRLENALLTDRVDTVLETTAGIRSLLIRFDSKRVAAKELTAQLDPYFKIARNAEPKRSSRIVYLPLSWDDPACREAIDRYVQSVRADAPWCPDNIEFIRRINGLANRDAVKDIVFNADYLVMGLGDVYLGAPVATAVDPRHRLVTTKYNPARIWTAENSVGIGGAYLCIYGMEGPGGYQFVGRTLQVWDTHRHGRHFDEYWLLRPFDRIRFFEVDAQELTAMREAFPQGGLALDIEDGVFEVDCYQDLLDAESDSIQAFETTRQAAFAAELDDWKARGLLTFEIDEPPSLEPPQINSNDDVLVSSPLAGSVWSVHAHQGQHVAKGDVLFVVESMKTEFEVTAPSTGVVGDVLVSQGQSVRAGQPLASSRN